VWSGNDTRIARSRREAERFGFHRGARTESGRFYYLLRSIFIERNIAQRFNVGVLINRVDRYDKLQSDSVDSAPVIIDGNS